MRLAPSLQRGRRRDGMPLRPVELGSASCLMAWSRRTCADRECLRRMYSQANVSLSKGYSGFSNPKNTQSSITLVRATMPAVPTSRSGFLAKALMRNAFVSKTLMARFLDPRMCCRRGKVLRKDELSRTLVSWVNLVGRLDSTKSYRAVDVGSTYVVHVWRCSALQAHLDLDGCSQQYNGNSSFPAPKACCCGPSCPVGALQEEDRPGCLSSGESCPANTPLTRHILVVDVPY